VNFEDSDRSRDCVEIRCLGVATKPLFWRPGFNNVFPRIAVSSTRDKLTNLRAMIPSCSGDFGHVESECSRPWPHDERVVLLLIDFVGAAIGVVEGQGKVGTNVCCGGGVEGERYLLRFL
jgi:hypothetical protein